MRICHINLAQGFRGGERQTQLLVEALSQQGANQVLVVRRDSELGRRCTPIERLEIRAIGRPFWLHAGSVRDCTILHAHEAKAAHFAYIAHKRTGLPYVITRRVPNHPKDNRFTRAVYRNAERVVAISAAVKDVLLHFDASLSMSVVPSVCSLLPHDAAEASRLRAQYHRKFVIGHIGALVDHHKGQSVLIDAARQLVQSYPHFHFVFLGDGKDADYLKSKAAGLNNVEFVGFRNNVGDYLSAFDLFAFPSREEGLGSILLDVMQYKVPIVATNVDGIPELIKHESTGLLFQSGDSGQLARAIVRLYSDSSLRDTLTNGASELAKQYTPGVLAAQYSVIYNEVCARLQK